MEKITWQEMGENIASFHLFARKILNHQQALTLTTNELDIMSWLFLSSKPATPLVISNELNLKKASLSRTFKKLLADGLVVKEKNPADERSMIFSLTTLGLEKLDQNYKLLLGPYYYLAQEMGSSFEVFLQQINQATHIIESYQKGDA